MALVLFFPSARLLIPRPDAFVPGAGEEDIISRGEREGGQRGRRIGWAAVEVGGFASLDRNTCYEYRVKRSIQHVV